MQIVHYRRNREQNEMIGIDVSTAVSEKALQRTLEAKLFFIEKFSLSWVINFLFNFGQVDEPSEIELSKKEEDFKNEIVQFFGNCPNCNAPCETNMKPTGIAICEIA